MSLDKNNRRHLSKQCSQKPHNNIVLLLLFIDKIKDEKKMM